MISCFVEIYLNCPLEVCVQRDVKGMYKRALAGELKNFTGVSDPYEEPLHPELVLNTHEETPEQSAEKVLDYLRVRGWEIAP
jgi:adenylylsulfate kinase